MIRCGTTCPVSFSAAELADLVKACRCRTPDTLRLQPWDRDGIHRLFDDLEFRVLRDRLFNLSPPSGEVDSGFEVRGTALAPAILPPGCPNMRLKVDPASPFRDPDGI